MLGTNSLQELVRWHPLFLSGINRCFFLVLLGSLKGLYIVARSRMNVSLDQGGVLVLIVIGSYFMLWAILIYWRDRNIRRTPRWHMITLIPALTVAGNAFLDFTRYSPISDPVIVSPFMYLLSWYMMRDYVTLPASFEIDRTQDRGFKQFDTIWKTGCLILVGFVALIWLTANGYVFPIAS